MLAMSDGSVPHVADEPYEPVWVEDDARHPFRSGLGGFFGWTTTTDSQTA